MPQVPSGYKTKFLDLPFIAQLKEKGYTYKNLPTILGTSRESYIRLFQEPERFTIKQITILSYLLNEPIPKLLNTFLRTQPQSPHYLKEDYSTNSHVEKIKAELATKLSKDQSEPK